MNQEISAGACFGLQSVAANRKGVRTHPFHWVRYDDDCGETGAPRRLFQRVVVPGRKRWVSIVATNNCKGLEATSKSPVTSQEEPVPNFKSGGGVLIHLNCHKPPRLQPRAENPL
jgi:hypothetical protein